MSQCQRCNKPCSVTAIFCDECCLLQNPYQTKAIEAQASFAQPSLIAMPSLQEHREYEGYGEHIDIFERDTHPVPAVPTIAAQEIHTPVPPGPDPEPLQGQVEVQQTYNLVEQALQRLNEAARRIAQAEGKQPGQSPFSRQPHAPRLTPLRDISAEIQRESTPLPKVSSTDADTQPQKSQAEPTPKMPDLWPWLQEGDTGETDVWANRTDPLLARQVPNRIDAARIEEEDRRRARAEGWTTRPVPVAGKQGAKRRSRMRLAFIILASLAVAALLVDGLLASLAFIHTEHTGTAHNGPPTLTLSSNVVVVGQAVVLHIRYFSPSTKVYLTHDIEQPIITTNGTGLVKVDSTGNADIHAQIDSSWGPGFHTVYAEDVNTRYTASSTLQITRSGSTRPSQLVIGSSTLDFGPDYQGANTIQPLTLHNSGDGAITWAASSNQPWLMISPPQGMFSASQTIEIAVERFNLKPGDYKGTVIFSTNVGAPIYVQVQMTVRPLPANAGAVLAVTPPVLSFMALDGASSPNAQVLTINNPGSQPLSWSLTSNTPTPFTFAGQDVLLHLFGAKNWLATDHTSGVVAPGSTNVVRVFVNSQIMLPGVYTDTLVFGSSSGTIDSPQNVSVSLTVQPRCGLTMSAGSVAFTAVMGQGNPSSQALGLSATSSCVGMLNWKAQSSAGWLAVTPGSGQLKGATSTVTTISVNAAAITRPGNYQGTISFLTGMSTQTVVISLQVQPPPPPGAPIMGASPLNLNYSATQGMANPPGQVVTITNNGGGTLYWHMSVTQLASAWLGASPSGGSIGKGQTAQVTVNVAIKNLTPGTYVGQITLNGTDASGVTSAGGSPQTIAVNLLVLPPCAMAKPSSSTLTFNATVGSANPAPQSLTITAAGNCGWPLNWKTDITSSAPWLSVSPGKGLIAASGQGATMTVSANTTGMLPGTYTTQISIAATDSSDTAAEGSPQVVSVTLTVQSPCSLQVSLGSLSFSVAQGQSASAQSLTISEAGNCARPVSWTAVGDGGSSSWLSISSTSGTDSGAGNTIAVGASAASLAVGAYSGSITVSVKDSSGATVQGSPQTVSVQLIVTGFSLSGTVMACSDSACPLPVALPGATVLLLNGSGTQVASATADASGNYSFSNIGSGSYTLSVTGILSSVNYSGTKALTLSGSQSGIVVDVLPV